MGARAYRALMCLGVFAVTRAQGVRAASEDAPVLLAPPDWTAIGLALAIVGSFLLANAILFRHPRHLVRERFGRVKTQLHTIREYIFHRVQVTLGFTLLLAGFALQLYALYRPPPPEARQGFPILWVTIVVVSALALLFAGWWWSLFAFRRYVRGFFLDNPPQFEADLDMAREVGELFGISSHADDTVHSYVERVRRAVLLPESAAAQARIAKAAAAKRRAEEASEEGEDFAGLDEDDGILPIQRHGAV